jgi:hypothetical protein
MATRLKAILDVMALAIEGTGVGSGDVRGYGWKRLPDSRETKVQAGGYRLLFTEADRDPEFGVDAVETLSTQIVAEFYRAAETEDDAGFFAELSILATAVERATYPEGSLLVLTRTRAVERQFSDPLWVVGRLAVQLKWEQGF